MKPDLESREMRIGDSLIVEEDGNVWPFVGSPRSPQRLIVQATLIWKNKDFLTVRLPRVRVLLEGEDILLPVTERRLPRRHKASDGALGGIGRAQDDPSEWVAMPFYSLFEGRRATARTATYYSQAAWDLYQKLLYDKVGKPDHLIEDRRSALEDFAALLAVPWDAGEKEILMAFRERVKVAHPDRGGDPAHFHRIVLAKDALLAALKGG